MKTLYVLKYSIAACVALVIATAVATNHLWVVIVGGFVFGFAMTVYGDVCVRIEDLRSKPFRYTCDRCDHIVAATNDRDVLLQLIAMHNRVVHLQEP